MDEIANKNWPELSQRAPDLQVKAFQRVTCEIGDALEKHGGSLLSWRAPAHLQAAHRAPGE